jgi:hypothetical protein
MSKSRNSYRVTVFRLRRSTKTRYGITIRYRRMGAFRAPKRGKRGHRKQMAAKAWVKCEGNERAETLAKLDAPGPYVRHQTDVRAIAAEIGPGPSEFLEDAYVYDNGFESWLILIADDEMDPYSLFGNQTCDDPRDACDERAGANEVAT